MTGPGLSAPAPIGSGHEIDPFDCGEEALDRWLKRQAIRNEHSGASRTFVVCDESTVVGYYCLAAGAVARAEAPKPLQRNMPDPVPVIVLGRLAVDRRYQGRGIGSALLRDAVLRTLQAAGIIGIRAILVHAISAEARDWYLARGFLNSPIHPLTLCLPLETARRALKE